MRLLPRTNGLSSLFKEVRVCKEMRISSRNPGGSRSDFRNLRFEPGTGKTRKIRLSLTQEKEGSEEIPWSENAENADTKTQKMRLIGFNVTSFR